MTDISTMTDTELKALGFEQRMQIDQCEANLRTIYQELTNRAQVSSNGHVDQLETEEQA